MQRRAALWLLVVGWALAWICPRASGAAPAKRPNILWISVEDMSPDLGCYGDRYAVTPNIDRLASQGVRYTQVFANSPVCAPSRSALITGRYSTSIGTHQMRCQGVPPPSVKCFPEYLRAAGYYCTNNAKTDYQFAPPPTAWDANGAQAHWRGREPGQPFFAVFNLTITHESQVRSEAPALRRQLASLSGDERHDPARASLPPYYPDTPLVRKDWARYYDLISLMDRQVGELLKQLEADGLAEDTIVWFWSDHGRGLPRGKRWVYDSGTHVPLLIRVPEGLRAAALPAKPRDLRPGTVNGDLISFVDFAPTTLALAGVEAPEHFQGQAFLGRRPGPSRQFVFASRDRMDETYDLIRSVRDRQFRYVRNFMPHVPYSQNISYMDQMPTMREMRRLHAAGRLEGARAQYFRATKPVEELFDTAKDPYELRNLAGQPEYQDVLSRMRGALAEWMKKTGDVGLIPEPEFDELKRPGGEWRKTLEPRFVGSGKDVRILCDTPGASIAYRMGEGARWKVYGEPVRPTPGQTLHARASRIGFRDSAEVLYAPADRPEKKERKARLPERERTDWRQALDKTDLLERLQKLKAWDGQGAKALPHYFAALSDDHAPVRYWAVIGLHQGCSEPAMTERAKTALSRRLSDPSPAVRIGAAQALCDWGAETQALPVLVEALTNRSDTVRLYAATSLSRIGEKARPALPHLQAAAKDASEYVRRLANTALRALGQPVSDEQAAQLPTPSRS